MAVIRILPPLVLTDGDVEEFVDALRATIKAAQKPRTLTKLAFSAASSTVSRH
jgi:hypothetical protein